MKVGVAGAGLLGRLLAFRLRERGHEVHVFDPAPDAQGRGAAGWTAAGMLSPVAELECADHDVFALGVRSLALWPALLAQLEVPVEFRREGSLLLAHRGDEGAARRVTELLEDKLQGLASRPDAPGAAMRPRRLEIEELRALEPSVRGPAHAWLVAGEGQIHAVQAMQALAAAARPVQWHWGARVQEAHAGVLRTDAGERRFDHVFDVRG